MARWWWGVCVECLCGVGVGVGRCGCGCECGMWVRVCVDVGVGRWGVESVSTHLHAVKSDARKADWH